MIVIIIALAVFCSCEAGIGYVRPENYTGMCLNLSCESLNYYANNSSLLVYNYTLLFLPGYHHLTVDFLITNASFLDFIAEDTFSSGEVVVTCAQEVGLVFKNIYKLKLKSLKFQYCSNYYSYYEHSALRFQDVVKLTLQDVHVHNSSGYGIVVKNIYGKSSIENCTFLYNIGSSTCKGGNALVEYSNCSSNYSEDTAVLLIMSSNFSYGKYNGYNNTLYGSTFATGLTVILSCNVHIYINNITVLENHNSLKNGLGGNMFIHFFNQHHFVSNHVHINNSRLSGGRADLGAGLGVTFFTNQKATHLNSCDNSLTITNSELSSNTGLSGCGIYLEFAIPSIIGSCPTGHISLVNTSLLHNVAELSYYSFQWNIGVAIFIFNGYVRDSLNDVDPFSICFDNITVQRSEIKSFNKSIAPTEVSAAIFSAKFVGKFKISNSNIMDNEVSGIALFRSKVFLSATILVRNNSGINGGGLILCGSSYIELYPNTIIRFIGNQATFLGGAIYSDTQCRDSHPSCFYQFVSMSNCFHDSKPSQRSKCFKSQIIMQNNTAGNAGMDIYGGNVANCYFHRTSLNYRVHSDIFYTIFDVSKNIDSRFSAVTSEPIRVCVCYMLHQYNCSHTTLLYDRKVYPGEEIHIPVVIVGQLSGTVPGTVLINGEMPSSVIYTDFCTYLPINVSHGLSNYVLQVFNAGIPKGKELLKLHKSLNSLTIKVYTSNCPIGFVLVGGKCNCDLAKIHSSDCNITGSTISREYGSWIGYNSINNTKYIRGIIYHGVCPLDYCDGVVHDIPVSLTGMDSDVQCSPHHTGLLCGACIINFSVALSSTQCLDCRRTSKLYPFWISLLYALCAILFIVTLITLDISITDGLFDGLLFYANVLYSKRELFRFTDTNFLTAVISLVNLDIGLISCFYDGMDTYAKTWFQLCMPQFLWLLIIIVVLSSKKFDRVAKIVGNNSAKILATLIAITFTTTLQACIIIFSCAGLKYPSHNGTVQVKVVWLHDANIDYLQGKHIPLFMAGSICLMFLLVYTMILLFVQPLQRYSHLYCFQWVNRLKPLIDAYTAPHVIRSKCRCWGGLLLLLRILVFMSMAVNFRNKQNIEFATVLLVCFILFAVSFVTGGVYKSMWLRLLNGSFLINLTLLSIGLSTLFTNNKSYYFGYRNNHESYAIVTFSSSVAVAEALAVLIYYISRKLSKCFCGKCHRRFWTKIRLTERNPLLEYSQDDGAHSHLID